MFTLFKARKNSFFRHQIRYYGWYSNKKRGLQLKNMPKHERAFGIDEPDTPYRRKCRMTWAALIKAVYEASH